MESDIQCNLRIRKSVSSDNYSSPKVSRGREEVSDDCFGLCRVDVDVDGTKEQWVQKIMKRQDFVETRLQRDGASWTFSF